MIVPFLSLDSIHTSIKKEVLSAIEQVYNANDFILGEKLTAFEEQYAKATGVNYCVGVGNGLDALKIALLALDINKGDEVIIPANTFFATLQAVVLVGAKPILVDVNQKDGLIDIDLLKKSITSKTKAILPVHMYGNVADVLSILKLIKGKEIYLIEDNAQAHLATLKNQFTGSFGHINATSFYPGKNLGALGDGGAITTNSKELADKCKAIRNYGSSEKYYYDVLGENSRLDNLQAAVLSVKLKYLPEWTLERKKIAAIYAKELLGIGDISMFEIENTVGHVYHLFTILTEHRDQLSAFLKEKNIQTIVHYPVPIHLQKSVANLGYKKGDFPVSEKIANSILSLPLFIGLTNKEQMYVVAQIKLFFSVNNLLHA
ncbi:DegT/DnrJ/EryC1/StrS family aminotransferase [Flammeovirga kamogawensis]|uniref:DegT/DnrJ/EryC1/StrS family aminotransferase n=1 Tax=Flammeovirga kamogawensis TaxID=373891 RepID=A0ABX8GU52_9BACT|nr:DegT/DnrJ/EryC1/StrS family aminotransferase [Flammeovirga kamogawensis]MBB6460003.1 dTDP-4-amino-4,6-dideoxygalactose transaminase [Flammeovirga kamogawensis]QWG06949.1 DegT/DnrJ/EryC1/StrS family aminotransferase [Flammeovirga kamogawensis]TRX68769.1 DegT/DnrJ/EryC1/StrS family aminotransferase [Flammeovirga kamogawensis]